MGQARRPRRRVLWVDDEIELLLPHRLILQQRGYEVDTLANGDDALDQLRSEPYDLILLDQQMPGRSGIDLLGRIRDVDPRVAVVMVTKSEDDATLTEAIGRRVDDYIVKPTSPRQVLSVVKRLLEGPELRHDRLSQDFVQAYADLQSRISTAVSWREWSQIYSELVDWELGLSDAGEEGLLESLWTLMTEARREFCDHVEARYRGWVNGAEDRPPLSVDVVPRFFLPLMARGRAAALVILDCLRLDQWRALRPMIEEDFEVDEDLYCSLLPTATPYARNAIFGGIYPDELAEARPGWPNSKDDTSLNDFEDELFAAQVERLTDAEVSVHYAKVFSSADSEALVRQLPSLLEERRALGLVFNFVDLLTHGRGESPLLFEMARDAAALRRLTVTWFEGSGLRRALGILASHGVRVLLTTDHGSIHCNRPATVYAKRDATANLRYKSGDDLRAENPSAALLISKGKEYRLPPGRLKTNYLIAREDYFFVYPTKLREYQARYRDSFLHGGVSPEEMILPMAVLKPR